MASTSAASTSVAAHSLTASRGKTFENSAKYSTKTQPQVRRGLFQRFLDGIIMVRQRQADREIARFLQSRGGKLTDETEREITDRLLSGSSGRFRT